jgi:hypothetical protein
MFSLLDNWGHKDYCQWLYMSLKERVYQVGVHHYYVYDMFQDVIEELYLDRQNNVGFMSISGYL